jgi:tetratricopeptide (TPR) repeat protein
MADQKTCFVVMGFGEKTDYKTSRVLDLDKTYKHIIKEAVQDAGLKCVRADEIAHSGTIDVPMYEQLLAADLVVADLSTSNLNATYELGVRHALKPHTTIIIAEDQFSSPFDVNHIVIRKYRHDGKALDIDEVERFRGELGKAIQDIMGLQQTDSPVYTFLTPLQPPVRGPVNASNQAPPAAASAMAPATGAGPDDSTLAARMEQVHKAKANKDFMKAKFLLEMIRDEIAPRDTYVVQQLALVTYKSKYPDELQALEAARAILEPLDPLRSNNAETLGLWGAIHKRIFEIAKDRAQLDAAIFAYEKGYRLLGDYYNAINWAFLLNLRASLSEPADAIADFVLARRARADVLTICKQKLETLKDSEETRAERYWVLATLAEASVGLGDEPGGEQYLSQAIAVAPESWMPDTTKEQIAKLRPLLAASPLKHIAA